MTNLPKQKKDCFSWSLVFIIWAFSVFGLYKLNTSWSLVPLLIAILLVLISAYILKGTSFFSDKFEALSKIRLEFSKVSWASFDLSKQTSFMVGVLIAVFALVMWAVDSLFTYIVKILL